MSVSLLSALSLSLSQSEDDSNSNTNNNNNNNNKRKQNKQTDDAATNNNDAVDTNNAVEVEAKKVPAPAPKMASSDDKIFWELVSSGNECSSSDVEIGDADSVENCAMRCAVFEGCEWFIFGKGDKSRMCWYEDTKDGCVNDGHLVKNNYNLYKIRNTDVNNNKFATVDGDYSYYRIVVARGRLTKLDVNASFCIEDIVFYDGNNTPVSTKPVECDPASPTGGINCCMSTPALEGHSCVEAFNQEDEAGSFFCSNSPAGYIGYNFAQPTYVKSYSIHDVYGVHALDPTVWTLQASKDSNEWVLLDTAVNTPWVSEDGVYNHQVGGVSYTMLFREAECSSEDIMLGVVSTVTECAELCANIDECSFFIYGKREKAGRCYFEITKDGCAGNQDYPQRDDYDLYVIHRNGLLADGGKTLGQAVLTHNPRASYCGKFFGDCSHVFLLLTLALILIGALWCLRNALKRRAARAQSLEYDETDQADEIEA